MKWWWTAAMVGGLLAGSCTSDGAATIDATAIPPTTTPTTAAPEVDPAPTTDTAPDTDGLRPEADGFYPWLFPAPTLSWYEEGCPSQEDVIRNFMSNFFDDPAPRLSSLSATLSPDEFRWVAHNRGEGGEPLESGTILTLARLDLDIVDCEAWGIIAAESDWATINDARLGAADDGSAIVDVSGTRLGFESTIELRVHDESFRIVAEGFASGGQPEPEPFAGSARFTAEPIDSNLLVIAASSSPAEGSTPRFGAVKLRCCDGLGAIPAPE